MRPIDKDVKYVMEYLRFRPGAGWTWRTNYRREFMDLLMFTPNQKLASLEYELRDCIRCRMVQIPKRLAHKVDDLREGDFYFQEMQDDIDF